MDVFEKVFLGNMLKNWLIAAGIIVLVFSLISVLKHPVLRRFKRFSDRTQNNFDDFIYMAVQTTIIPFLYYLTVFFALQYLSFGPRVSQVLRVAILFIGTWFVLRLITSFISYAIFKFIGRQDDARAKQQQARGLIVIIKAVVWIIGFVFLLNNIGYDVTTIIAGLGIGGIAIALAAQTILGDLFSYFVIFFDRPFEIGDFLVVDDKVGAIEYIGIKTTRMKAISGEQIVFSNKDLTDARVHNFKRMLTRRVVFNLGVTYQTPAEKLQRIPEILRNIITPVENVTFDRSNFSSFGDSGLNFETVYIIDGSDYNMYMDIQQSIYFQIFKAFEAEKIEFAYPTQTLFISGELKRAEGVDKSRELQNRGRVEETYHA
jgi:small-conductance mechanosensitive channel